ncbi:protein HEXIM1-like [Paramormyrops kingsleyae]|uniref:HEXIM P-TEFb complex subunit 1 n=1 Tax=Paramormyrops kingsleyae TaxID=1676925 RepID=A0A3B3QI76_9TELE|nr:protein HEXIM-like [Paramormyrops kingsleyae]
MSEPEDQSTPQTKTSHALSGGSATVLEHPVANENGGAQCADRGRCADGQQTEGGSSGGTIAENLWNRQGGQQEVCAGMVAGNAHPKCPVVTKPCQEPEADTAGEGGLVAHGNSGDGPTEETHSQVQGESGKHVMRMNSGSSGARPQALPDARMGKKKHRRRPSKKKRRWKPYFKLSWEEKKELDERETARASRVRAEMFAKGLPVAPYNTTQFLMEEHDREEPDLNTELASRRFLGASRSEDTFSEEDFFEIDEEEEDGSGGGSDGIGRPGNVGGEFLQRDFSETYEKYHVESLQNMTKQELVREYLELEKCMSRLEEENNRLRRAGKSPEAVAEESPVSLPERSRVRELEVELEKLRAQNSELRQQNQQWRESVHAE